MKAPEILKQAAKHIEDRAAKRDRPDGERSMGKTVAAFNAVTGNNLSERDGWVFMQMVKLARACTTSSGSPDDYEDAAAFSALAGEAASHGDAVSKLADFYNPIERIRADIVQADGSVGGIDTRAIPGWRSGSATSPKHDDNAR